MVCVAVTGSGAERGSNSAFLSKARCRYWREMRGHAPVVAQIAEATSRAGGWNASAFWADSCQWRRADVRGRRRLKYQRPPSAGSSKPGSVSEGAFHGPSLLVVQGVGVDGCG